MHMRMLHEACTHTQSHQVLCMQLADISEWGDGKAVARVLLPPGVRPATFEDTVIERPPRDTRTVAGVVELPPLHVYKCACCVRDTAWWLFVMLDTLTVSMLASCEMKHPESCLAC